MPPGHTDFGFYTIFPHCPICAAAARIKRWQQKYPTALYTCHVCGHQYSPAKTASSQRMDNERERLRDLLGPERFLTFAKEYLLANGETSENADLIIQETEERERIRQEKLRDIRRLHKKKEGIPEKSYFCWIGNCQAATK